MIYIFDKTQAIIKVLTNDDFTAAHLNFKINTATTFEFSLPASKALPSDSKFVATPHPLNNSKFIMLRLTERVDNTETIDYSAYELAYQELATDGYIEDKRPQNQSALNLMKIALDGSNWELNNVNVSGTATTNFYYVDHLSAISNVVDLLGGEIVFYIEIQGNAISGRYMDYLARQGTDTSKVFASGSNLLTVERQSDTSNIYTAILPRGKGEEIDDGEADTPDGYGRRINIADVEWKKSAGNPLDKPKGSIVLSDQDATAEWGQINGNARLLLQTYDDIDDVNVLINSAYKTLQSVNHPQIQYSATVADVGGLSLGDTVLIMHGDRDLSYKTRVFEVKYDLLAPDQTELSLGDDLSSNSITSQINSLNAVADTTSSQTQWTINQIGRPSTTFGNTEPANPKVGDVFFKELPDGGTEIYRWNGDIWELLASPTTADDIAAAVDDAVSQANAHTDEVKQSLSTDIETAKSQAASQSNTAEANAKSAATSQFTQAQSALSAAKSDLTNSIASEASARNAAVAAANSQAQTYANQAKADAMSAASSADGVIRTAISSSANSLSATITQNKSSADSGISTAQTTAQQAVDGLKTKVSQTDYNAKTGQLQTDLTATTQTANQAKTDIVSIKQKDSDQDAKMNSIVSDANGTKQTVSDLQTTQGKQSGDISTLQQRADGFDATVTKINNTVNNLGQINQLMNTEFTPDTEGWTLYADKGSNAPYASFASYGSRGIGFNTVNADANTYARLSQTILLPNTRLSTDVMSLAWRVNTRRMDNYCHIWLIWQDANGVSLGQSTMGNWNDSTLNNYNVLKWENISIPVDAKQVDIRFETREGTNAYIFQPMVSFTNTIGTYVQGNYNNSGALAQVKITADKASLDLSNYQNDADGRISKAQAGVEANANAITQKVSQTDYDKKTGDLSAKINTAQSTADGAVTTIGNYQTSNDKRVKAAESSISQNADNIALKVSKTDYDNNNSNLNTRFTRVEATANGASTTVSDLQQTVNNLGQVNQLFNTEFSPDLSGWTSFPTISTNIDSTQSHNGSNVIVIKHDSSTTWGAFRQSIANFVQGDSVSASVWFGNVTGNFQFNVESYNASSTRTVIKSSQITSSGIIKFDNLKIPADATQLYLSFWSGIANSTLTISQPMLVFAPTVGTYVQGNYNNNAALAQVKITADSISNFVRDSSSNISSDFQTALSKTSIITGSTLSTSIQTQTSSQITQALTDNNKNIIAMINLDTSGVQIAGKNIILDGNTTVTGDFYAKGGNFKNLNASNLTVGTLNGSQVNITNINANNIVSGAISGANLNINLNTGSVVFQKGRINSSDYTTDINIDQGYISTANGDTRVILKKGQLQLTSPDYYDLQTNPYLSISNDPRTFDSTGKLMYSAVLSARDRIVVGNEDGISSMLGDGFSFGQSSFYGLSSGKTIGKKIPTVVGGGATGVVLVGGSTYTNTIGGNESPSIVVGWSPDNVYSGNRIRIDGNYFHVGAVYNKTSSASSNVVVNADGALVRSSSARKYKLDIKNNIPIADSLKLIDVPLSTWVDKHEHEENGSNERYFGMIAEDLRDAGLEYLVQYGEDNEVEGINYDRVALLLIPLVKKLKERIEELESKGK